MEQLYSRLGPTLLTLIELILIVCTVTFVFLRPSLTSDDAGWRRIEHKLAQFSRRKALAVVAVGSCVLGIRTVLIAVIGIPQPRWNDEFSFLLAADTFAQGRLTNPTHPMWAHFETLHVIQRPSYMSMYAPGQGLILALGKKLGHPWIGQLVVTALMCSAICWMLQAWVPAPWALYGAALAALRLGLFGYWVNTYWCASLAALGGVLLLGAWPRLRERLRLRDALFMAVGFVILANTRPFEGLVFSLPFAGVMLVWLLRRQKPAGRVLNGAVLPILVVLLAGGLGTGYYYYRVTGSPFRTAYEVNRETYAMAPYFIWGTPRAEPEYRSTIMREFYRNELAEFRQNLSVRGYLFRSEKKFLSWWRFYLGPLLTIPLITFPCFVRQKKLRFPLLLLAVMVGALAVETFMLPHYYAPAVGLLYLFVVQGSRWLVRWSAWRRPVGRSIVRGIPVLASAMILLRISAIVAHVQLEPAWYGQPERAKIANQLSTRSGRELVFVHFGPNADYGEDWVYNRANIDSAKVIWANDLGNKENRDLIRYFPDRTPWLANVDGSQISFVPYPRDVSQSQHTQ